MTYPRVSRCELGRETEPHQLCQLFHSHIENRDMVGFYCEKADAETRAVLAAREEMLGAWRMHAAENRYPVPANR